MHRRAHRLSLLSLLAAVMVIAGAGFASDPQDKPQRKLGYDDGPKLPDSEWRVHDGKRPQPRIVTPAPADHPFAPPSDAIVLFDGKDLAQWTGRDDKAQWKVEKGYFEVNGTGDIQTRQGFGSCQIHLEWQTPPPKGDGQGRGNSGLFFFGRYEIQILDSYGNQTYPDGQAGALYGQRPPLVNVSRPPGEWQTYDVIFEAPRFAGDQLVEPAYATVIHNGVVLHNRQVLLGTTNHRSLPQYSPHGPVGPIKLQDHGNPMRFRNIWIRPLTAYDAQ